MDAGKIAETRAELARAEKASGSKQQEALSQLVSRLEANVNGAGDAAKVLALAGVVRQLGTAPSVAQR
jgi:hypothetical protein